MISKSSDQPMNQDAMVSGEEPLHVHDLPQLYTRPSAERLIGLLQSLALTPTTFSHHPVKPLNVSSDGLATYLTQFISSSLLWIDESIREEVWELASLRLSERSGRSAAPAMTREFVIDDELIIALHEPSLTGDNLGLKTWSSSLMLAKKLDSLKSFLPDIRTTSGLRVLELGAGTGLVGIAAACVWSAEVVLSDLPEIMPNLSSNVKRNEELVVRHSGKVTIQALDWNDKQDIPLDDAGRFSIIVAADPLYSPEHPKMLVGAVGRWLRKDSTSRFVIAVPLRNGYNEERLSMRQCLLDLGLEKEEEGEETGFDDWEGTDGQRQEVRYSWSVWKGGIKWSENMSIIVP